jgi:tetratricopeptide (TPR) repeat protein
MLHSICYYFLVFILLFSACQEVDIASDEIPPLVQSSSQSFAQQIKFMNEIIEDNPTVAEYYYRRSLIFLELKSWKLAQADINKAIQLNTNKGNYFYVKALVLEKLNLYVPALLSAQIAENKGLQQVDLYLLLSRLYYKTKQPIQTVQYLQKVKRIYPQKPEVYYQQGLISYDVEDTLNTIRYMNEAIAAQPEFIDAYKYLFRLYDKNFRPKAASVVLQRAMQQEELQNDSELNKMFGDILLKLDKRDSATMYYSKAIAYDSANWQAADFLGHYYIENRNYELGVHYLQIACKANPKLANANYLMAAVYEYHLKNYVKAKLNYEIAKKLDTANYHIAESIKKMEKRILYEEYRKSPAFILDQIRKKQDSLKINTIIPNNVNPSNQTPK